MFLITDLKTPNNLAIKIKPIPASSMKMQIRGHLVPGCPGIMPFYRIWKKMQLDVGMEPTFKFEHVICICIANCNTLQDMNYYLV